MRKSDVINEAGDFFDDIDAGTKNIRKREADIRELKKKFAKEIFKYIEKLIESEKYSKKFKWYDIKDSIDEIVFPMISKKFNHNSMI